MANHRQFNTINCVATPLHPQSRLPMPSYERKASPGPATSHGRQETEIQSESPALTLEGSRSDETNHDAGMIQTTSKQPPNLASPPKPAFQLSLDYANMMSSSCENCGFSEEDDNEFYRKLTQLKEQNILHLQQLESEMNYGGEKYKRSGSVKSDVEEPFKKPLFVLDMPCYCAKNEEEQESVDETFETLFDGVSDDSDLDEVVTRSSTRKSLRVQSAPIVIVERPTSAVLKPTVLRPFKMTLR